MPHKSLTMNTFLNIAKIIKGTKYSTFGQMRATEFVRELKSIPLTQRIYERGYTERFICRANQFHGHTQYQIKRAARCWNSTEVDRKRGYRKHDFSNALNK